MTGLHLTNLRGVGYRGEVHGERRKVVLLITVSAYLSQCLIGESWSKKLHNKKLTCFCKTKLYTDFCPLRRTEIGGDLRMKSESRFGC